MFLFPDSFQPGPQVRDGLRGSAEQHAAAQSATHGNYLGQLPTPGKGPIDNGGSGYIKPIGGQNP